MSTPELNRVPPEEQAKLEDLRRRVHQALGKPRTPYPVFPELTDSDFIPGEGKDEIGELRKWIRRAMVRGMTQSEVEDYLISNGFAPEFAIELICSVRLVDQANDVPLRRQRRHREAAEGPSEPAPELDFGAKGCPAADRLRYRRGQAVRYWAVVLFLAGLVAVGVWQALRK